jgi:hypothetical protein
MADEENFTEQERVWGKLYARIREVIGHYGNSNYIGEGDYWLLDDNWGMTQHKLYVNNLKMLEPVIIKRLQACLADYSDWEIVVAVDVPGSGDSWPPMGLIVRPHEMVDGLQRQYFPKEFQGIKYEGSRPGTVSSDE